MQKLEEFYVSSNMDTNDENPQHLLKLLNHSEYLLQSGQL